MRAEPNGEVVAIGELHLDEGLSCRWKPSWLLFGTHGWRRD